MPINRFTFLLGLLLPFATGSIAAAELAVPESRLSTTTLNGQVLQSESREISRTEHNQHRQRNTLHVDHGLWIYDFFIDLSIDNDADGHYSTFAINLDIDNSFSARDVYVVFYLSQNQGPWLEYAVTGDFTVSGTSSLDSISVETTLDTGYANDYYDLYAEVYDSYSGELLLSFGPGNSSYVVDIPFESYQNDTYYSSDVSVQLSFSGSGSLTSTSLLFLLSIFGYRAFRISRHNNTVH